MIYWESVMQKRFILSLLAISLLVSCQETKEKIEKPSPIVSFGENTVFKDFCVSLFDTDGDGNLTQKECDAIKELDCSSCNLRSLEGIKNFRNLETLFCYYNLFNDLDFSGMDKLKYIYGESSNIHSLNLTGCKSLLVLDVHYNYLSSIDISSSPELFLLSVCFNPPLERLDVSSNPRLGVIYCQMCSLTELILGEKPALFGLHCWNNALESLDLSGCTAMEDIWCGDNELNELDFRNCPMKMSTVSAPRNPRLYRAYFREGQQVTSMEFPNITLIHYE